MRKYILTSILVLILFLLIFSQNCEQRPPVEESNKTTDYPIVLVHGWLGKAIDFNSYANRLHEEGVAEKKNVILNSTDMSICPDGWPKNISVRAEYYYPYNINTGIEEYAKELKHAVDITANCTGSDQVIIVAHSMGGIVSRKYMADYGHEKVHKLITLASPHYGFNNFTKGELLLMFFDIFTGKDNEVEQLRPGSDFLEALDQTDKDYRNKIVSIGTYDIGNGSSKIFDLSFLPKSDFVVKLDSTKLKGSKYYAITGCSHTEITDFRVLNEKGSIKDAWRCNKAYQIVKNEIFGTSET